MVTGLVAKKKEKKKARIKYVNSEQMQRQKIERQEKVHEKGADTTNQMALY